MGSPHGVMAKVRDYDLEVSKFELQSCYYIHIQTNYIYPTPPLGQDMTQGQFFKRSLTGLNSEFSFS